MDTGLLIDMFVPNVGVAPPPSKPAAPNAERFASVPADNTPAVNEPPGTTPDNTPVGTQEKTTSEPHQDFDCTLQEQIGLKEPQKGRNTSKSEMKTSTSSLPSTPGASPAANQPAESQPEGNNSQIVSTQALLTEAEIAMPGKAAAAAPDSSSSKGPGPKIPEESVQLAKGSKITQLPNLTTGAPKQTAAEPGPAAPAVPKLADKPAQSTAGHSQNSTETVQPDIFKGLPVTDTGSKKGEKAAGFQVSDKGLIVEHGPAKEGNGKGLVPELIAEGGKVATGGEKSADAVKPAVSSATPAPHNNMAVTGGVSTDSQLGGDGLGPKKSVPAFGEANNKADTGQQSQTISESPDGNGKEASLGEKGLPGDSILQKLNVTEVQVSSGGQIKGRSGTASNNNSSNSDFERVLSHDNAQIPVAEQPSAAAQAGKAAGNASASDVSATVSEQIRESIYSSVRQGDQQITIRLHPPELGKVFIKFQEQEDQITGLLEVSKAQTRAEIQQALPEIVRNLQGLGVQIRRLEVVLTNEQERQAFNGQSPAEGQNNWSGRQSSSANPDTNGEHTGITEWLTNNSGHTKFIGLGEAFVTDESIDMLA